MERLGLYLEQPNEGWGAVHTLHAFGPGLYPGPGALFLNNYPPVWFWLIHALTPVFGDVIVTGRIVALAAFFALAAAIYALARRLGVSRGASLIGALGFGVTGLTFFRVYVGISEPQMLAHALATAAAALAAGATRRRTLVAAALLTVVALLVKQVVIGLPIAVTLWLLWRRRSLALAWIVAGAVAGLGSLAALVAGYGAPFVANVTAPRYFSWERFGTALGLTLRSIAPLVGFAVPAVMLRRRIDDALAFAGLAIAAAFVPLVLFGSVLGVSINIGLDLAIAANLGLAVGWDRASTALGARASLGRGVLAAAFVALALVEAPHDVFDPAAQGRLQAKSAAYVAIIHQVEAAPPGPVLCEALTACVEAGRPSDGDLWKLRHERTLAFLHPAPMLARLRAGGYAAVVLLGPPASAKDDARLPGFAEALASAYQPPVPYPLADGATVYLPKARP